MTKETKDEFVAIIVQTIVLMFIIGVADHMMPYGKYIACSVIGMCFFSGWLKTYLDNHFRKNKVDSDHRKRRGGTAPNRALKK